MLGDTFLFSATSIHVEHIMSALNCLSPLVQRDDVLITIDKDGLSFVRENYHTTKIQLFLSKELFQYYSYRKDPKSSNSYLRLSMKFTHLIEGISIASNRNMDNNVECTLSYNGDGSHFLLILDDSLVTERLEYSTYLLNDNDSLSLELDRSRLEFECIIRGDVLYSALTDLKEIGCKDCYMYAMNSTHSRPIFALLSKSSLGLSKIILPSEKSILEKLVVYSTDSGSVIYDSPVIAIFDFSVIDKLRLSAKIASKALIRKDIHGLLTVNILSHTNDILVSHSKQSHCFSDISSDNYLGIVVEFAAVEKAITDGIDARDIQFMISSLTSHSSTLIQGASERIVPISVPPQSKDNNLLGFPGSVAAPTQNSTTADDNDDSYNPVQSSHLSLFF